MKTTYPDLHEKLAMIIEAARRDDGESLQTDSSSAATDILQLLTDEDRIKAKVIPLNIAPQVMVM